MYIPTFPTPYGLAPLLEEGPYEIDEGEKERGDMVRCRSDPTPTGTEVLGKPSLVSSLCWSWCGGASLEARGKQFEVAEFKFPCLESKEG